MSRLVLMMGAPGSGKSYWAEHVCRPADKYISRDKIRFSMLKDGDDYFSKEKEVFKEFIKQIDEAIKTGYDNVFADATHLNPNSRLKTLRALTSKPDEIAVVFLKTPLETCLARNSLREGRKFVPETSIKNMYHSIELPEAWEGIKTCFIVEQGKKMQIKVLEG